MKGNVNFYSHIAGANETINKAIFKEKGNRNSERVICGGNNYYNTLFDKFSSLIFSFA